MKQVLGFLIATGLMLPGCTTKEWDSKTDSQTSSNGQQTVTVTKTVVEQNDRPPVTTEKLAEKTKETLKLAGEFAAQNKDEFVAEVKRRLASINQQLMEWDAQSESWTADAKAKWNIEREKLHQRQLEMQRELEMLESATGAAWGDVKAGATAAWKNLADGFSQAAAHFDTNRKTEAAREP